MIVDGHEVRVQVSLGVSAYPKDGDSFGALLHVADTRMYEAKHAGRGR
jgi:diguanylate cyclase (GGDEF)-like protein